MFYKEVYILIFSSFLLILMVLVGVSFLTLLERKILGYIQIRKGPNKLGIVGILQPFSDAIKLFSKEQIYPTMSNYMLYYVSPIFNLFLSLICWMIIPYFTILYSMNLGFLFFLSFLSLGVYSVMIAGWSSNSKFSLLGGLRSVAQTISYEVCMLILLMSLMIFIEGFNFMNFYFFQKYIWFIFMFFPLSIMWFVIMLSETNRSPFDFAEGESELVSGFNIEYSSGGFSLIFMSEYSMILLMSMMFCLMFLGGNVFSFFFYLKLTFISFMFILVRGSLPRFRYDKLMYLMWKMFLLVLINFLVLFFGIKYYMYMMFL
uniref:NADH-ubiquinone oxidoreductase chain 1 n=1 Tax=Arge similis TaxID=621222 RepID=A0A3S5HLN3_9HYME|nr:NADH dehydrogenase subunit 1 [Arge similis]